MKMICKPYILTILVGFLLVTSIAQSAERILPRTAKAKPTYVEGEVLIKFKDNISQSNQAQIASASGSQALNRIGRQQRIMHVKLPEGQSVEQAVAAYSANPNVEHAQPNYLYYTTAVPNDTDYGQLWGLNNTNQTITNPAYTSHNPPGTTGNDIDAELAWDVTTGCSAAVVAVLDTGVDYTQLDLASNMWDGGVAYPNHGYDFIDSDNDPIPVDSVEHHGTHVAGTIGARGDNGQGTTGVCWQATIMSVRVCGGSGGCPSSAIIQGIGFAYINGAKVINMSLSGPSFDSSIYAEIRDARDNDVVVVAAAGNDGADNDISPAYPCSYGTDTTVAVPPPTTTYPALANIICVAALDQAYNLSTFSNYGVANVNVGAPGVNILSSYPGKTIIDTLSSGWTLSGGWAMTTCSSINVLVNPADWCTLGTYAANADDRIYKTFNLSDVSGAVAATVEYLALVETEIGFDYFRTAYKNDGGDPFAGGVQLQASTGSNYNDTGPNWNPAIPVIFQHDLTGCLTVNCSLGFQLESDSNFEYEGVGVFYYLTIDALELGANKYQLLNGTSMATPHVAGITALVRAYNPDYTYTDTVNAIEVGGEDVAALAATTSTGKAANAMGSLAYINPPTGVTAVAP